MGTVNYTQTTLTNVGKEPIRLIKWSGMVTDDVGQPIQLPHYTDKSIQVYGTFGSGGSVKIEGSNDLSSPTYATLHTIDLSALVFGSAGIDCIVENPNFIRPNVTAGDETTELTVIICVK